MVAEFAGGEISTGNAPLSTSRRALTESAVALVLAVGGSLFTVGIVALPDHAGAPLHTELQKTLDPLSGCGKNPMAICC